MPTIADQVATMEHDHAAALALIDQLKAANDALTSANTGLRNENVALGVEVSNMKHYVDDTRAMVETLASSAYDMLRTTRRQVDTPAEVIPFAPKAVCEHCNERHDIRVACPTYAQARLTTHDFGAVQAYRDEQDAGNANALASDSGDEQPAGLASDANIAEAGPQSYPLTPLPAHAGPMLAEHKGDLPIFLKRDTAFGAGPDRAIFG